MSARAFLDGASSELYLVWSELLVLPGPRTADQRQHVGLNVLALVQQQNVSALVLLEQDLVPTITPWQDNLTI